MPWGDKLLKLATTTSRTGTANGPSTKEQAPTPETKALPTKIKSTPTTNHTTAIEDDTGQTPPRRGTTNDATGSPTNSIQSQELATATSSSPPPACWCVICEALVEGDSVAQALGLELKRLKDTTTARHDELLGQVREQQQTIADLKCQLAQRKADEEQVRDMQTAVTALSQERDALLVQLERFLKLDDNPHRAPAKKKGGDNGVDEDDDTVSNTSRHEEDERPSSPDGVEGLLRHQLMEELRQQHAEEVEALRQNLMMAELEISETRREMDAMQVDCEELCEGMEAAEQQRTEMQSELARLRDQLAHEKDLVQNLQQQQKEGKEKEEQQQNEQQEKVEHESNDTSQEAAGRLRKERDAAVQELAAVQRELVQAKRRLEKQQKAAHPTIPTTSSHAIQNAGSGSTAAGDCGTDGGSRKDVYSMYDSKKELASLRRQNKSLQDKLNELRQKLGDSAGVPPPRTVRRDNSWQQQQDGHLAAETNAVTPDPTRTKSASSPQTPGESSFPYKMLFEKSSSPSTAQSSPGSVSGLVATFEKRINNRQDCPAEKSAASGNTTSLLTTANKTCIETNRSEGNKEEVIEMLKQKVAILEKENHHFNLEIDKLCSELGAKQTNYSKINGEHEVQEEVQRLRSQVGALQSELEVSLSQIAQLNEYVSKLENALDARNANTDTTQEHIIRFTEEEHMQEMEKLRMESEKRIARLNEIQFELSTRIENLEVELEKAKEESSREIVDLTNRLSTTQSCLSERHEEVNRLQLRTQEMTKVYNDDVEALTAQLSTARLLLAERDDEINKFEREHLELCKKASHRNEIAPAERGGANGPDASSELVRALEREIDELKGKSATNAQYVQVLSHENQQLKEHIRQVKCSQKVQQKIQSIKSVQEMRERNAALKEKMAHHLSASSANKASRRIMVDI